MLVKYRVFFTPRAGFELSEFSCYENVIFHQGYSGALLLSPATAGLKRLGVNEPLSNVMSGVRVANLLFKLSNEGHLNDFSRQPRSISVGDLIEVELLGKVFTYQCMKQGWDLVSQRSPDSESVPG